MLFFPDIGEKCTELARMTNFWGGLRCQTAILEVVPPLGVHGWLPHWICSTCCCLNACLSWHLHLFGSRESEARRWQVRFLCQLHFKTNALHRRLGPFHSQSLAMEKHLCRMECVDDSSCNLLRPFSLDIERRTSAKYSPICHHTFRPCRQKGNCLNFALGGDASRETNYQKLCATCCGESPLGLRSFGVSLFQRGLGGGRG